MTRTIRPAGPRAALLPALLLVAAAAGCGSDDDVARTYSGVAERLCGAIGTTDLVSAAYPGLAEPTSRGGYETGDAEAVATCTVEAAAGSGAGSGAGSADLPGEVTVAITVSVLAEGDPADDFSRLADYADDLYEPAAADDVRESSEELDDGWWSRGTSWRTSWTEAGDTPQQLVESAAASRDNLLVSVLVVERDLAAGTLAGAEERVHRLVLEQLAAADDAAR